MIKLSIIVPVYKVERYIEKCIHSLENQDLSKDEFEVIVVDDGSPDSSIGIVERLQSEYSNIKVYRKENGGQSSARNLGMQYAEGEYIWFVDSDDYVVKNVLSKLLNMAYGEDLDILMFDTKDIDEHGNLLERRFECFQLPETTLTGTEYVRWSVANSGVEKNKIFGKFRLGICISPWAFIFKKNICTDNHICFLERCIHEDYEFNLHLYKYGKRIKLTEVLAYIYIKKAEGTTTSTYTSTHYLHRIHSWQEILMSFKKLYSDLSDEYSQVIQPWICTYRIVGLNILLIAPISLSRKKKELPLFVEADAFCLKGKCFVPYPGKLKSMFFKSRSCYKLMMYLYAAYNNIKRKSLSDRH